MSETTTDNDLQPMDLATGGFGNSEQQRIRDLLEQAYIRSRKNGYGLKTKSRAEKREYHLGPRMRMTVEEYATRYDTNCEAGIAECWYVFDGLWVKGEWHLQGLPGYMSVVGSFRKLYIRDPDDNEKWIEVTNIAGEHWRKLRREVLPYLESQLNSYDPIIPWEGAEGREKLLEAEKRRVSADAIKSVPINTDFDVNSVLKELDHLVGLNDIKSHIKRHAAFLQLQQKRRASGKNTPQVSLHSLFTGPPGTGKTTVAQIMGKLYHRLGLLPSDEVIVAGLNDLTGTHMGQTSEKITKLVESARGKTLLIDEAYSLNDGGGRYKGYGAEAINTLLPLIEKYQDEMVVIMAGYSAELEELLGLNPGLASRFSQRFEFPAYNGDELAEIFLRLVDADDYEFETEDLIKLVSHFGDIFTNSDPERFGNARFVRTCYQQSITAQAERVMHSNDEDVNINLMRFNDVVS